MNEQLEKAQKGQVIKKKISKKEVSKFTKDKALYSIEKQYAGEYSFIKGYNKVIGL